MHETTRLALVKKSSGSILVVEDDADFARSLKRTFGAAGYSVEVASSAEEAFEKVTRDSFDLVITDLNLPARPAWRSSTSCARTTRTSRARS